MDEEILNNVCFLGFADPTIPLGEAESFQGQWFDLDRLPETFRLIPSAFGNPFLKYKDILCKRRFNNSFRPIKELDAEIRKIVPPPKDHKFFIAEVGIYESLGELGMTLSLFFTSNPSEDEIKKELRKELLEIREGLSGEILGGREERYLKILNKILPRRIKK